MPVPTRLIQMLKHDLKVAGIPYRDDADRVADFHSLGHTCGSWLTAAGIHPKLIQSIMRPTITLTMNRHTHPSKTDEAAALAPLPDLSKATE